MEFTIYNSDNAPEESKSLLTSAKQSFGFIPNLLGELAEAPAVLEGYLKLNEIVGKTSFTAEEQQLAILTVSIENECHYCSAIHSTILKNQLNVEEGIVNAVRNGESVPHEKYDALVSYVRSVILKRGFVNDSEIEPFLNAGYTNQNVLEVNLIAALKTISNYTNHIAETPLDEPFEAERMDLATA